jgi:hypothetical protein
MRYLSIFKTAERNAPITEEESKRMGQFIEQMIKRGKLLSTEGCLPTKLGARVKLSKGKVTVTDGPFAEAKEVVGGFAILQADSREEAIELTREFLAFNRTDGECELRQLYEAPALVER